MMMAALMLYERAFLVVLVKKVNVFAMLQNERYR